MENTIEQDKPVGYLLAGGNGFVTLCCDCAAQRVNYRGDDMMTGNHIGAPVFTINLGRYQQHCCDCNKSINKNAHPRWCELFDGR